MILLQIIIPAVFIFIAFVVGHLFVSNSGSGLYVAEMNFDPETVLAEPVEVDQGEEQTDDVSAVQD